MSTTTSPHKPLCTKLWSKGLASAFSGLALLLTACAPTVVLPTHAPTLTHTATAAPVTVAPATTPTVALPPATATHRAYPPDRPFPGATATLSTPNATVMAAVTSFFATRNAGTTPLPLLSEGWVYDPLNHFKIQVPAGWYAYTPSAGAVSGVTRINNYSSSQNEPPGWVTIQLSAGNLAPGQTLEQWMQAWRETRLQAEDRLVEITLTEPEPIQIGAYHGFSYFGIPPADLEFNVSTWEIDLAAADGRIMVIGIKPADSPAVPEALRLLDTLDILAVGEQL